MKTKMKNTKLLLFALAVLAFVSCDGKEPVGPGGKNVLAETEWKLVGFFDVVKGELIEIMGKECDDCYTLRFFVLSGEDLPQCRIKTTANTGTGSYRADYSNSTIEFVDTLSRTGMEELYEDGKWYYTILHSGIRTFEFELKDVELKLYYNNRKNYLLFKSRQ